MSFWYGLGFDDLCEMPMAMINHYLDRLPARMAEYKIALAGTSAYPHMKDSDRNRALSSWRRDLELHSYVRIPPATPEVLTMMGIGVRRIPAKNN